jgi:hypothetical protein
VSVFIGAIDTAATAHTVWASKGGVETHLPPEDSLTPTQARNLAALLVRGAEEVERMRQPDPMDRKAFMFFWDHGSLFVLDPDGHRHVVLTRPVPA